MPIIAPMIARKIPPKINEKTGLSRPINLKPQNITQTDNPLIAPSAKPNSAPSKDDAESSTLIIPTITPMTMKIIIPMSSFIAPRIAPMIPPMTAQMMRAPRLPILSIILSIMLGGGGAR